MLIVDEVSLLGWNMMRHIDQRLRQIMDNPAPFGGLHVIFVGDFFQLAPVRDAFLFKNPNVLVENLWVKHFEIFELTEIMREKEDLVFAQLLNRMREGSLTETDKAILHARLIDVDFELPYLFAFNEPKYSRKTLSMRKTTMIATTFEASIVRA